MVQIKMIANYIPIQKRKTSMNGIVYIKCINLDESYPFRDTLTLPREPI